VTEPLPRGDPRRRGCSPSGTSRTRVLPARADGRRSRHARHQARPPVRQGGAREVRASRGLARRARRACSPTPRMSQGAGAAVPRGPDVHGGPLLLGHGEVRPRAVGARLQRVAGGELVLQLRGLSSPARKDPIPRRQGEDALRAYPQRLRPGLCRARSSASSRRTSAPTASWTCPRCCGPYLGGAEVLG
jgi:hypothetical protein